MVTWVTGHGSCGSRSADWWSRGSWVTGHAGHGQLIGGHVGHGSQNMTNCQLWTAAVSADPHRKIQVAQLSQRDRAAVQGGLVIWPKWKTGTGRQYFYAHYNVNHCDVISQQGNPIR